VWSAFDWKLQTVHGRHLRRFMVQIRGTAPRRFGLLFGAIDAELFIDRLTSVTFDPFLLPVPLVFGFSLFSILSFLLLSVFFFNVSSWSGEMSTGLPFSAFVAPARLQLLPFLCPCPPPGLLCGRARLGPTVFPPRTVVPFFSFFLAVCPSSFFLYNVCLPRSCRRSTKF